MSLVNPLEKLNSMESNYLQQQTKVVYKRNLEKLMFAIKFGYKGQEQCSLTDVNFSDGRGVSSVERGAYRL